jgi:hypothetical protein
MYLSQKILKVQYTVGIDKSAEKVADFVNSGGFFDSCKRRYSARNKENHICDYSVCIFGFSHIDLLYQVLSKLVSNFHFSGSLE